MRSYEEYEDDIVDRIAAFDFNAGPLPSTAMLEAFRPVEKARVYVLYTGSDFGEPSTLAVTEQEETLSFDAHICCTRRRDRGGVYETAGKIMRRLRGWRPKDAFTPVKITAFGNIESQNNAWNYVIRFSFTRYVVQEVEYDAPPKLIKKISHKLTDK